MDTNITGKLKDAITSKLAGEPELRRNVIKSIDKAEQTENITKKNQDFLNNLEDPKNIYKIYQIIKNKKNSVKEKRKQIKKFLKKGIEVNDFFKNIVKTKTIGKKETKEATSSGSAGGYETLFGSQKSNSNVDLNSNINFLKVKTVREQIEKVESKEATSSSSSGQYNQPAIWAKSLNKKNWKGASIKYMPGAKRVQVKKKCKKFPYCNQGDITALKIFENQSVQNTINKISTKYMIDRNFISKIIFNEIKKTKY